jgi:transcriptional regulator with XRE-family HTH domain
MSTAQFITQGVELHEVIRAAIKRTGMTLAEVGEALDVHEKTVGRWQRGETPPDFAKIVVLAHLSGMPVEAFAQAVRGPSTWKARALVLLPPMLGQQTLDFDPPPALFAVAA